MSAKSDLNDRLEEQRAQAKVWMEKEAKEKEEKLRKEEEKSAKKRNKKKRPPRKVSLMKKMMVTSLGPLIVMGLVVTIYTIITMKTTLRDEKLNSLTNFAISVRGSIENSAEGTMTLNNGVICIGDKDIGSNPAYLDTFTNDEDIKLSLYYGDKSYLTTFKDEGGARKTGAMLEGTVKGTVLSESKVYTSSNDKLDGVKYYSVYLPIRDGSKKAVGALLVCQPVSVVDKLVNSQVVSLATIAIVIFIASIIIVGYSSISIARTIKMMEESLTAIADGYLSITVNMSALRRNDEIGTMARALQNTAKRMTDVVHEINSIIRRLVRAGDNLEESSEQTSVTATGISTAVEEISKGAISQASDVEKANDSVTQMGDGINAIVDSLSSLKESTEIMLEADKQSEEIISELFESGTQTAIALDEVTTKVNATDRAVEKIQEAVSIITNIADETSLLSLNASIEAARAGEAGRGFSVVAVQIQKLADESAKSAERIRDTIEELSRDSHASVQVMAEMADVIKEQQDKLELTRKQFEKVSDGINSTIHETTHIYGQSQNCARERENVLDIIQSLSAVSEQNASSTESTTNAMTDLNGTISTVAESAKNLQKIALTLEDNVKFFKL